MSRWSNAARAAALLAGLTAPTLLQAAPYTTEIVFGDSYSDDGNQVELVGRARPNPPSFQQESGNGPLAAQVIAQYLGLPYQPSLWATGFKDPLGIFGGSAFVPGNVYAVAGSTAGPNLPGTPPVLFNTDAGAQVTAYVSRVGSGNADPGALYYFFAGGNDIRTAALMNLPGLVASGVAAELGAIQTLINNGARNFLIPNVQDIGTLPEFAQDNAALAPTATTYSLQWDALLATGIRSLQLANPTASLTLFDFYDWNTAFRANAAQYGITDIVDRCYTASPYSTATSTQCGANAQNIDQLYWWDFRHPTAVVDRALGLAEVAAVVPEPGSLVLLGSFAALLATGRGARRRRAAAAG